MKKQNLKIAFFGTSEFAVKILGELKKEGFTPSIVIATPDKPQGRKLALTPPLTKIWAKKFNIPILQPVKLKNEDFLNKLKEIEWDLFIVASYGKIIPQEVLDIPRYKTINVHPSLLPKLRGASPMQSAILKEDKTGMTIMLMDSEMDHGPILMQKELTIPNWPPKIKELESTMAKIGGEMLTETIPLWINRKIKPKEQNHREATYIDKIEKKEAFINLKDSPEKNYRKIQALQTFKPYFFAERNGKKIRVIIKDAEIKNGELIIKKVLPEGKKEMNYSDFLRGNQK